MQYNAPNPLLLFTLHPKASAPCTLTGFTVGPQVSCASAIAYVAVPAFVAVAAVGTGLGAAAPVGLTCAGDTDARHALQLGKTPQVSAPAVHKHVPRAAHEAQPQRCCPHLGGQRESLAFLRETAKVHLTIQVQDLAAFIGGEGHAAAIHRHGAWRKKRGSSEEKWP